MGLIKCPDCGKEFSDRIDACPNCACPTSAAKMEMKKETTAENHQACSRAYSKSDLMSSEELKEFIIQNITPYVAEELQVEHHNIFLAPKDHSADIYVRNGSKVTGIVYRISVAPNRYHYVDFAKNENFVKDMEAAGYECAYADVSIGAADSLRFDRRVVLKNDKYYFDYRELIYPPTAKDDIRYSLSPPPSEEERSKVIYGEQKIDPNSWAAITVKAVDFQYNITAMSLRPILEMYHVPDELISPLAEYLHTLAIAIKEHIGPKELVLSFINCVDYCHGIFLSDSKKVIKAEIIPTCVKLLDSNDGIKLTKYEQYTFAFYLYHFIQSSYSLEPVSVDGMNQMKIQCFEENPKLFGFMTLKNTAEKREEIESVQEVRQVLLEEKRIQVISVIRNYLNESISDSVEKGYHRQTLENLRPVAREISDFYIEHGLFDEEIKSLWDLCYSAMNLMEFNDSLQVKSEEGRFGFFEKKKSHKESQALRAEVEKLLN